jgi:ribosomal protein S18
MKKYKKMLALVILMAFTISLLAFQTTLAEAARSEKPKEIVVVGSKIKEVVKEAGLYISDQAVMTLSQNLVKSLHDAFRRAERNRRYELIPLDLSYPDQTTYRDDEILNMEILTRFIPELGFILNSDFLPALNAQANRMIDIAIERANANFRDTIEPYDF